MDAYLLSLLIFTPALGALVLLMLPGRLASLFRSVTLVVSLIQLLVLIRIFQLYQPAAEGYQLMEHASWITLTLFDGAIFRAEYLVALDGLNFPLVVLSVCVLLIATVSSWNVTLQPKGYFVLLLILNTAILGSFTALDLLLFYLFFEFMLLPMYFLIGIWGGPRREYASIKFFLYTLLGSIFILLVIIGLYLSSAVQTTTGELAHTFNLIELANPANLQSGTLLHMQSTSEWLGFSGRHWAFLLLFIGFAIKLPMAPLHTWLPDAHVEASTPISIILAALLLKIGGYGMLRMILPIFPDASLYFGSFVAFMGMFSILYGALNALAAKDLKRLIAYSSVSHMGFVLLGIASGTNEGINGAQYQMVSHGFISAMLFALAGVLYDRTHDRLIANYSGLTSKMPHYAGVTFIAFLATMGLPGFSGFIGEVMVFFGAFRSSLPVWITILAALGLILAAGYCLWLLQRMFFGPFAQKVEGDLTDLSLREKVMLWPLALIVFVLGIFPQLLIQYLAPFTSRIVTQLSHYLP